MQREICEVCGHCVSESAMTCPGCNDVRRRDMSSQASLCIAMCAFAFSLGALLPPAQDKPLVIALLVLLAFLGTVIGFGPHVRPKRVKLRKPSRSGS